MTDDTACDSDRPAGISRLQALQFRAGRLAINVVNWIRPRVTLGVRLLALDGDGRVFLVRHTYLPGHHLPGGGVGPGETCREAALREAAEEGGLVLPEPPALFHVYLNRALANRDHVVLFVARGVSRDEHARTMEIAAAGFYPPDRLPEDATPATRARLAEVLEGRPPPDVW